MNGAGIRLEAGSLTCSYCMFTNNQRALMTGNVYETTLTLDHAVFRSAAAVTSPPAQLLDVGQIKQKDGGGASCAYDAGN